MNCNEVRAKIPSYQDDSLSPYEKMQFQSHLKNCQECQSVLLSFSSVQRSEKGTEESNLTTPRIVRKTAFKPMRSRLQNNEVQDRLQAAGIIAPMHSDTKQHLINQSEESEPDKMTISSALSGEELLRRHILSLLAAEESSKTATEINTNPLVEDRPSTIEMDEEKEFIWTPEMSLETAMAQGDVTEVVEEIHSVEQVATPTVTWQENPELFVEIPYTHPVTRLQVIKKVRRNSLEGMMFLESEAENLRQKEQFDKMESTVQVAEEKSLSISEELPPPLRSSGTLSAAEVARERLYSQWNPEKEATAKFRTVNQNAKTLPFRENSRKQAVFYRFLAMVSFLALGLVLFLLWKSGVY